MRQRSGNDGSPRAVRNSGRPLWLTMLLLGIGGTALGLVVRERWRSDLDAYLVHHRRESHGDAMLAAWRVGALFQNVHARLRVIARMPDVRALGDERAGFADAARAVVAETIHDLVLGARLTGVHATRVAPGSPVLALATGTPLGPRARAVVAGQVEWLRTHCPSEDQVDARHEPALLGPEVPGEEEAEADPGRTVLVYSVPFFGADRQLRGCVSGTIPADAVRALIPRGEYAVVSTEHRAFVPSAAPGPWAEARELATRGQADPGLLYSEVLPLDVHDLLGRWRLWAGKPDSAFFDRSDVHASARLTEAGYAAVAVLTLVLAWVVLARRRSRREIERALHALEDRVLERTRELQSVNDARGQLLASMSQELGSPTRALLGSTEQLLQATDADPERRTVLQTIRRSGDHLLTILNEVLDFARLEAGKLSVTRSRCSPHELLEQVAGFVRPRATERRVELEVRYVTPLPATVLTDPARLRQILLALLNHALQHTEQGNVRLLAGLETGSGRSPLLELQVVDTGLGMTEAQLARLFTPFRDPDDSAARRASGSGLGLVIAQRLAQMLEGAIHVRSTPGAGTTFTVRVGTGPLAGVPLVTCTEPTAPPPPPAPAALAVPAPGAPPRILLIEDGADDQRAIATMLHELGAEVSLADDARIGCELALEVHRQGEDFDLILMDMQLPELDGYAATARLRAHDYRGGIVALTGDANPGEPERCRDAGCDDHLAKPVDAKRLAAVVTRLKPR